MGRQTSKQASNSVCVSLGTGHLVDDVQVAGSGARAAANHLHQVVSTPPHLVHGVLSRIGLLISLQHTGLHIITVQKWHGAIASPVGVSALGHCIQVSDMYWSRKESSRISVQACGQNHSQWTGRKGGRQRAKGQKQQERQLQGQEVGGIQMGTG